VRKAGMLASIWLSVDPSFDYSKSLTPFIDWWLNAPKSIVAAVSSSPPASTCSNFPILSADFRILEDPGSGAGAIRVYFVFVPFNCAGLPLQQISSASHLSGD
jgi:hypothetical protein